MMVSTSVLDDTKTKTALIAVLVAILFYFGIKLGHYLATPPDHIATFWPPNTIVLAALLLSDKRRWWIFILAITPVYIFGALQSGFSVPRTLIFYTANCTEVLVAAFVINYACQEKTINLNHFKDMVIFLLSAVLLAPVISACIASSISFFEPSVSFWLAWRVWFLGDAIAHLTLTPALILWFSFIAKARSFYTKPALGSLYFAELTVFIVLLITVSFIALGAEVGDTQNFPALLYAPLPLLLWAALRFGPREVCSAVFFITLIAIWNAVNGSGPFNTFAPAENVLSLQLFLIVVAVPTMLLSALLADRKESLIYLSKTEERWKFALEGARDGVWDWNMITNEVFFSPRYKEIIGYKEEELANQFNEWYQRIHPDDKAQVDEDLTKYLNGEAGIYENEHRLQNKAGNYIWVLVRGKIISWTDEHHKPSRMIGTITDISANKHHEEQLKMMAHYDVLTGLPNRVLFTDRFMQSIAHTKRTYHQLAVCFLDLDDFKPVNDNYGHTVGDQLLIEVANRITANIREEDTVSRQGGDEFALLLNDIETYEQCKQTLERIHHALAQPYIIDNHTHIISASTGVTLYPLDYGDVDTLLRHADQAMYQAKLAGKNCYQLFNPKFDQLAIEKYNQLEQIEHALKNNDFRLYYQPKVNMVTGEVFGAEALIRWCHPEKGIIPPLDFLPALENSDLEIQVGDWVINEALAQVDRWQKQDLRLEVSINISARHLLSEPFFEQLKSALNKYPSIDRQSLQLEILESSDFGDLNAINIVMRKCHSALGIRFALDDFGTGYSSLVHLKNLTADTIKIDRNFVRDILDDPSDYSIIDGIIRLADSFGRGVIAEGVETTNQGLVLLIMGCQRAQGYCISKPIPADDFPLWLSSYTPNEDWQHYGHKYLSTKENKLKLFALLTQHWHDRFINNIQSSDQEAGQWPITDSKQCPCGSWIKRMQQEQLFQEHGLQQINDTHEAMHLIAESLYEQYQNGHLETARKGLEEHQFAFNKMLNAATLCK